MTATKKKEVQERLKKPRGFCERSHPIERITIINDTPSYETLEEIKDLCLPEDSQIMYKLVW